MNWKRWYRAVIISTMLVLLFAPVFPAIGQSAENSPLIHHASVQPTKVHPGDTMTVTAEVSDSSGIKSVTANMGGIETISLDLIEGSIYHGTWQGQWLVHDTGARDYVTTVLATNFLGKASTADIIWRDPQTYERYEKTNNTEQTTTAVAPSWTDALSLTFTPNVAGNFLVIADYTLQNDDTSAYTEAQVVYDSTPIGTNQFTPKETTEKGTSGTHDVLALSAQPYTFKIQFRTSNAAATARISKCRLNIIDVDNYEHIDGTDGSTTQETYQDAATLVFTPASDDYVVIATMELAGDATNRSFLAQLIGGPTGSETSWGEIIRQPTTANEYHQYAVFRNQTLTATEHTFKIQYMSESGGGSSTTYIRRPRITAVRLSDLGDAEYQEAAETEQSTASATYVTVQNTTWDHTTYENVYRFGYRIIGGSSTAKYSYAGVDEDGVLVLERDMQPNDSDDRIPLWGGMHKYFDNASHTVLDQYKTESPATAYVSKVRRLVIRMDTLTPYEDSGHTTYCNNFNSAAKETVYIQACYFNPSDNFTVAYYDHGGTKVISDNKMTDANGVLNSQWHFPDDTGSAVGTWHAVIYDNDVATPPSTYTANDPVSVRECTFEVTPAAIPEFPTVMAGIVVAGLCFGVYYWMRKRRLAYVKA